MNQKANKQNQNKENFIVVDGANVAYAEQTNKNKPKMENLKHMRDALEAMGFTPIIIVDAALRHTITQDKKLESLFDQNKIYQAPADTDADYFVINAAKEYNAPIVTNDTFGEYQKKYDWLKGRRVPYMIIRGKVFLYQSAKTDSQK